MAATAARDKKGTKHDTDRKQSNIMLGKTILSAPNRIDGGTNSIKVVNTNDSNLGIGGIGGTLGKAFMGGQQVSGDAVAKSLIS